MKIKWKFRMAKSDRLVRLICISIFFLTFYQESYAYTINEIDKFKAVFTKFPKHVPSNTTVDAPITGNGDIGLTMAPSLGKIVFYVGKNDFWKAVESYPDGKIALPGGLTISSELFKEESYYAEQLPGHAELKASFKSNDNFLQILAWVPALENKVVIELESTKRTKLQLNLWTPNEEESKTKYGIEEGCSWVHRSFDNIRYLLWPTYMAMAMNNKNGEMVLEPGQRRYVIISIYTNHDTNDWHENAIQQSSKTTTHLISNIRERHYSWWTSYWALSGISIEDSLLEQFYYQSQYVLACSSREGKFAPGIWGPFITSDNSAWSGDYHLNYNYESPYWACFSSNHISLTENFEQPMLDYMERGKVHAINICKCRGILYPVGLGPKGLCSSTWPRDSQKMKSLYGITSNNIEDGVMFWGQKTNASFVAANMMMHFYSTYDKDYASKIYPFVRACADFWGDYLVYENGRYVIKGDVINETEPWKKYGEDFNSVLSLGLARMIFQGVDALSRFLNVDKSRRSEWHNFLDKLSNFPIGKNNKGEIRLKYYEKESLIPNGVGRIYMHGTLIPTGLIGSFLTPRYTQMMLDDLLEMSASKDQDWGNSINNGIETIYPGAVRVGYPAKELLSHLKERIRMGSHPNCYIYAGGGGIETLSAVPNVINEMMMQSYEGIIRIFPNWDVNLNGSFDNLRAYGAFLVSSSIKYGEIQHVTIKSEKGRPCKLKKPWPYQKICIKKNGKKWKTSNDDIISFNTKSGDFFDIECVKW